MQRSDLTSPAYWIGGTRVAYRVVERGPRPFIASVNVENRV